MTGIGNILGDIRAENDHEMLKASFWETQDYKTLLTSNDRCVVVGRRGTGKSALVYRLDHDWRTQPKTYVIKITPDEDQVIGLREIIELFGTDFLHIKAGSKIAWRYALYMELAKTIAGHYKASKALDTLEIATHLKDWSTTSSLTTNLRKKLKNCVNVADSPHSRIADLSEILEIEKIESLLKAALKKIDTTYIFLIDKLDEGYSPDTIGIGIVDGFAQAVIDVNSKFPAVKAFIFLRDNIYRSIAQSDPDFTRNIEGQVLRLHWDEYNLFNLVCNRLRIAFQNPQENNTRIWNTYTAREVSGKEGFRLALRLTLYRPRDILVLLNNSFLKASGEARGEIILNDLEASAKSISQNRLLDLQKEYESIFPILPPLTKAFIGADPELSFQEVQKIIKTVMMRQDLEEDQQREVVLFNESIDMMQRLYSIGFLGTFDASTNTFIFCHDGKDPSKEFTDNTKFLIHPCYWMSLNLTRKTLEPETAEEINDEYDIQVTSTSQEDRKHRLGQIISELQSIKPGKEHASDFEDWCLSAVKLVFAGALTNIATHPNPLGVQQRDIVGTNAATKKVWKRIYEDYKSRQIIFEVKNYSGIGIQEYRQMNSYLSGSYGSIGFIICRDNDNNLTKGNDLAAAQEIFFEHKKVIIKLSDRFFSKHLSKLRSPQKHDAADTELDKLIDTYVRTYLTIKKSNGKS